MIWNIIILIILIITLYAFFYIKNNKILYDNTFIQCKECVDWSHKDISSKCDSLCKTNEHNHSVGFTKNLDGSINCDCQKDKILLNEKTEISTPTINLPKIHNIKSGDNKYHYVLFDDIDENIKLSHDILKKKIEGFENLTNITDDIKKEQYAHYHKIIFG